MGLGQGQGTVNGWTDCSVIGQAIVCHYLLDRYSRTETAIVKLWLAGFEIQTNLAQTLLAKEISWRIDRNKLLADRHTDDLDDLFAKWSGQIARRLGLNNADKAHSLKELIVELLNLVYFPDKRFDGWDFIEIVNELFGFEICEHRKIELAREIKLLRIDLIPFVSIREHRKLILSATRLELESANHFLRKIRNGVIGIVSKLAIATSSAATVILAAELTSLVGQLVSAAHIHFLRNGGVSILEDVLVEIESAVNNFCQNNSDQLTQAKTRSPASAQF